ncbi:unnamed protein product [Effrenium voratum]|nr:unnamed protein product [Effrenium voratum]
MCWTLEITLAAATFETCCMLILCLRGRCYDRANASLVLPLVLQEWLQVLLWAHIGQSSTECDSVNRAGSAAVAYLVCAVPAWLSLQPRLTAEEPPEYLRHFKLLIGTAVLCGVGGALVQVVGQATGWMTSVCTYPGPWHRQVWPVLNIQYNIAPGMLGRIVGHVLSAGNLFLYAICSVGGFMSLRPSFVLPTLAVVGVSAEVLILFLGREWGSFWCFQASLLVVLALIEPWLFKRFGEINAFAGRIGSDTEDAPAKPEAADVIGATDVELDELDSLVKM